MLSQPDDQLISHSSCDRADPLSAPEHVSGAALSCLSNCTCPSRADPIFPGKPGEVCCFLVWVLEMCGCSFLDVRQTTLYHYLAV